MMVGIVKVSPAAEMTTIGNSFDWISLLAGPALMSDSISILNASAFAETTGRLRPQPNNDRAPEGAKVYRSYCESQDLCSSGARCFRQWCATPPCVSLLWSEDESFVSRAFYKHYAPTGRGKTLMKFPRPPSTNHWVPSNRVPYRCFWLTFRRVRHDRSFRNNVPFRYDYGATLCRHVKSRWRHCAAALFKEPRLRDLYSNPYPSRQPL